MEIIKMPLTNGQLETFKREFGDYLKVTVDVSKKLAVIGVKIHVDGGKLLLENAICGRIS